VGLGSIWISQKAYIKSLLAKYEMTNCKPVYTPFALHTNLEESPETASKQDRTLYQSIIGSIMYAMTTTRPDLAYAASKLSRFNNNPGSQHFAALTHVLQYLKTTADYGINYETEGDTLDFHGYTDSDWGGDVDRRLTSGFVFLMAGAAVSWRSKHQTSVATSSTEAEYMASAMASHG